MRLPGYRRQIQMLFEVLYLPSIQSQVSIAPIQMSPYRRGSALQDFAMRRSQNLFLICALVGFILFAPQPARAQSNVTCSANPGNLSVKPDVILDCLRAGQPVNFDGITVKGDLDLTSLQTDAQPVIAVPAAMSITNSHFTGSMISYNGNNDSVLIFQGPVD